MEPGQQNPYRAPENPQAGTPVQETGPGALAIISALFTGLLAFASAAVGAFGSVATLEDGPWEVEDSILVATFLAWAACWGVASRRFSQGKNAVLLSVLGPVGIFFGTLILFLIFGVV